MCKGKLKIRSVRKCQKNKDFHNWCFLLKLCLKKFVTLRIELLFHRSVLTIFELKSVTQSVYFVWTKSDLDSCFALQALYVIVGAFVPFCRPISLRALGTLHSLPYSYYDPWFEHQVRKIILTGSCSLNVPFKLGRSKLKV